MKYLLIIVILVVVTITAGCLQSGTQGSPTPQVSTSQKTVYPKVVPLWSYTMRDPINSVAMSADGQYIAVGSGDRDRDIIYYFSHDGKLLWNYSAKYTWGNVVGVSPDGQFVIVYDDDKIMYFSRDGKLLSEYRAGFTNYKFARSADGEYLASTGLGFEKISSFGHRDYPGTIYFYHGKILWNYSLENIVGRLWNEFRDVAMSADGQYVAAVDKYGCIYYLSRGGKPLWSYDIGTQVSSVAMSADGQYVAAGTAEPGLVYLFSHEGKLLWNHTTKNVVNYTQMVHIASVDISADGQYVAAGTNVAGDVYYFSRDGKLLWNQTAGGGDTYVDISADGQYIIGRGDSKLSYFSHDGKLLWSYYAGTSRSSFPDFAMSADGQYVAVGASNIYGYGENKMYYFSREGKK